MFTRDAPKQVHCSWYKCAGEKRQTNHLYFTYKQGMYRAALASTFGRSKIRQHSISTPKKHRGTVPYFNRDRACHRYVQWQANTTSATPNPTVSATKSKKKCVAPACPVRFTGRARQGGTPQRTRGHMQNSAGVL